MRYWLATALIALVVLLVIALAFPETTRYIAWVKNCPIGDPTCVSQMAPTQVIPGGPDWALGAAAGVVVVVGASAYSRLSRGRGR